MEFGSSIEDFLESIYIAGVDFSDNGIQEQARSIEKSYQMLKLLENSVNIMRNKHKNGEMYYWLLYYSYYVPDESSTRLPFYIIVAGHFLVGPKFYTRRESLSGYQCILTLDGSCTMEIEGEKPFECTKGSLLILDCMKKHYYHTGKERTWQYKHFHFDTNFSSYLPEQALGLVQLSGSDIETTIDNIFRAISQQRPQSSFLISDLISHILTESCSCAWILLC